MVYNSERITIYKSIISNPIQCKLWIQYPPKPLNNNLTIVYIDLTFNHEHHKDAKNSHHPPIIYRCNTSLSCWNGRRCWRYCLWQHCYEKFLVFNSQCLATPQMYHFLPGSVKGITSLPLVRASVPAGAAHCWKPVPLTLRTLWAPSLYLKTAPRSWFFHHQSD
jgi:hypothetical protein